MRIKKSVLLFLCFTAFSGCANDQTGGTTPAASAVEAFDFQGMFRNYTNNIITPAYEQAQLQHDAFQIASAAFCGAIGGEQVFPAAVRQTYVDLMQAWQTVEMMQVGPLQQNVNALRNEIHSFNVRNVSFSECLADQSVAKLAADADLDIATRPLAARGLTALEYLVFSEDLNHNCPVQVVDTQSWNGLSEAERMQHRCDYVTAVSDYVGQQIQTMLSRWYGPSADSYREIFINPANAAVHIKQLSDAIFYIEKETKDAKLGVPSSLKRPGCSQIACPDALESPFAQNTKANVITNLAALQTLLNGGTGLGFDDLLAQLGAQGVADRLNTQISEALALARQDQPPFYAQLETLNAGGDLTVCQNAQANPDVEGGTPVCRLHGLLKRITDTLRVEFVTAINIDLPERVGGDGD